MIFQAIHSVFAWVCYFSTFCYFHSVVCKVSFLFLLSFSNWLFRLSCYHIIIWAFLIFRMILSILYWTTKKRELLKWTLPIFLQAIHFTTYIIDFLLFNTFTQFCIIYLLDSRWRTFYGRIWCDLAICSFPFDLLYLLSYWPREKYNRNGRKEKASHRGL